jgi:hypothetical protein
LSHGRGCHTRSGHAGETLVETMGRGSLPSEFMT